ncbi:hypothetical protein EYV94_22260 [Puteibacter caeruleilacunae]|nr:hypothetical protein EYV94_22260 [Puteibacter caeruleilacunae]
MNRLMIPFVSVLAFIFLNFGCSRERTHESYFGAEPIGQMNLVTERLKVDSIVMDKVSSSYIGKFFFNNNVILFWDEMLRKVLLFDTNGHFLGERLTLGKGPNEVPISEVDGFSVLKDGSFIVFGGGDCIFLFDQNWNKKSSLILRKGKRISQQTLNAASNPGMSQIYDVEYEKHFTMQSYNNKLYFPIECMADNLNPALRRYYEESRIIFEVDKKTGELIKMEGRRSPVYQDYSCIGQFSWFDYDISRDGRIYVMYEPDHLIYEYNQEWDNTNTFGVPGKKMDTNYFESTNAREGGMRMVEERESKGYYTDIIYFEEYDILMRSYQKGLKSAVDGLQIYQNRILVADVDVPKGFKVIGIDDSYFYANGVIDEEWEEFKVYRFKVSEILKR